jgi:hypothetical protein
MDRSAPLGGLAGLMAMKGREGDTELVHMTKGEIKGLQSLGQMTVNPDTGLLEAFSFRSILPMLAGMAATAATGGAAAPAMFTGSSFILPALAAGATSAIVNKGDMGKIAFDSVLAGAGGALSGAELTAGGSRAMVGNEALGQAALANPTIAGAAGVTTPQALGAGLADTVKLNAGDVITAGLGFNPSSPVLGGLTTAGGVARTGLGAVPGVATTAMGIDGTTPEVQPLSQRTPASSAYGTRAAEQIKQVRPAQSLSKEEVLSSALGQSDPLQYFQGSNQAVLPAGLYSNTDNGAIVASTGGGLMDLYEQQGGDYSEFAGLVQGEGDGMSDDVHFNVKEEEGAPDAAMLSKDEYVLDAHTVSALGNGSTEGGAKVLDDFVKGIRQDTFGRKEQPKQINGLAALAQLI